MRKTRKKLIALFLSMVLALQGIAPFGGVPMIFAQGDPVVRVEEVSDGGRTCKRNIHRRADGSEYPGGLYGCSFACEKDKVVDTRETCSGNQTCRVNVHQREDCSTYEGGAYACQQIDGKCGYTVPRQEEVRCEERIVGTEKRCRGQETCQVNRKQKRVGDECRVEDDGGLYSCQKIDGECGYSTARAEEERRAREAAQQLRAQPPVEQGQPPIDSQQTEAAQAAAVQPDVAETREWCPNVEKYEGEEYQECYGPGTSRHIRIENCDFTTIQAIVNNPACSSEGEALTAEQFQAQETARQVAENQCPNGKFIGDTWTECSGTAGQATRLRIDEACNTVSVATEEDASCQTSIASLLQEAEIGETVYQEEARAVLAAATDQLSCTGEVRFSRCLPGTTTYITGVQTLAYDPTSQACVTQEREEFREENSSECGYIPPPPPPPASAIAGDPAGCCAVDADCSRYGGGQECYIGNGACSTGRSCGPARSPVGQNGCCQTVNDCRAQGLIPYACRSSAEASQSCSSEKSCVQVSCSATQFCTVGTACADAAKCDEYQAQQAAARAQIAAQQEAPPQSTNRTFTIGDSVICDGIESAITDIDGSIIWLEGGGVPFSEIDCFSAREELPFQDGLSEDILPGTIAVGPSGRQVLVKRAIGTGDQHIFALDDGTYTTLETLQVPIAGTAEVISTSLVCPDVLAPTDAIPTYPVGEKVELVDSVYECQADGSWRDIGFSWDISVSSSAEGLVELSGSGESGASVEIGVSSTFISTLLTIPQSGRWSWMPNISFAPGTHTVTVKTEKGIVASRQFEVSAERTAPALAPQPPVGENPDRLSFAVKALAIQSGASLSQGQDDRQESDYRKVTKALQKIGKPLNSDPSTWSERDRIRFQQEIQHQTAGGIEGALRRVESLPLIGGPLSALTNVSVEPVLEAVSHGNTARDMVRAEIHDAHYLDADAMADDAYTDAEYQDLTEYLEDQGFIEESEAFTTKETLAIYDHGVTSYLANQAQGRTLTPEEEARMRRAIEIDPGEREKFLNFLVFNETFKTKEEAEDRLSPEAIAQARRDREAILANRRGGFNSTEGQMSMESYEEAAKVVAEDIAMVYAFQAGTTILRPVVSRAVPRVGLGDAAKRVVQQTTQGVQSVLESRGARLGREAGGSIEATIQETVRDAVDSPELYLYDTVKHADEALIDGRGYVFVDTPRPDALMYGDDFVTVEHTSTMNALAERIEEQQERVRSRIGGEEDIDDIILADARLDLNARLGRAAPEKTSVRPRGGEGKDVTDAVRRRVDDAAAKVVELEQRDRAITARIRNIATSDRIPELLNERRIVQQELRDAKITADAAIDAVVQAETPLPQRAWKTLRGALGIGEKEPRPTVESFAPRPQGITTPADRMRKEFSEKVREKTGNTLDPELLDFTVDEFGDMKVISRGEDVLDLSARSAFSEKTPPLLKNIEIKSDVRARGLGSAVTEAWEETVRGKGYKIVAIDNVQPSAEGFWLKKGYAPVLDETAYNRNQMWAKPLNDDGRKAIERAKKQAAYSGSFSKLDAFLDGLGDDVKPELSTQQVDAVITALPHDPSNAVIERTIRNQGYQRKEARYLVHQVREELTGKKETPGLDERVSDVIQTARQVFGGGEEKTNLRVIRGENGAVEGIELSAPDRNGNIRTAVVKGDGTYNERRVSDTLEDLSDKGVPDRELEHLEREFMKIATPDDVRKLEEAIPGADGTKPQVDFEKIPQKTIPEDVVIKKLPAHAVGEEPRAITDPHFPPVTEDIAQEESRALVLQGLGRRLVTRTAVKTARKFGKLTKRRTKKEVESAIESEIENQAIQALAAAEPISPEAYQVGGDVVATTGEEGNVAVSLEPGKYTLDVSPPPTVVFTSIPDQFYITDEMGAKIFLGVRDIAQSKKTDMSAARIVPAAYADEDSPSGEVIPTTDGELTVQLFYDENENGRRDVSERILPWAGITIVASQEQTIGEINLIKGWNLVGFSNTSDIHLASDVVKDIVRQGGYATTVARLVDGAWEEYIQRGAFVFGEDFVIRPGEGYFIRSHTNMTWRLSGTPVEPQDREFTAGWYVIAVPPFVDLSSTTLLDQAGDAIDLVEQFRSGLWKPYVRHAGEDFGDTFDIEPYRGYLLRVRQQTVLRL